MIRTCMSEVDTHDLSHSYSSAYSSVTKCCLAITRDNNRKKRPSLFMPDTAGRAQTAQGKLFPATIHQKTGFCSVTIHFPANPREV